MPWQEEPKLPSLKPELKAKNRRSLARTFYMPPNATKGWRV